MSDERSGATELTQLMGAVLQSDTSEAFGEFMVRHIALGDLAPHAEDAVTDGVDASPDGGDAMARAHLQSLSEEEREQLLEKAAMETGRRLHAAASTLIELTAFGTAVMMHFRYTDALDGVSREERQ